MVRGIQYQELCWSIVKVFWLFRPLDSLHESQRAPFAEDRSVELAHVLLMQLIQDALEHSLDGGQHLIEVRAAAGDKGEAEGPHVAASFDVVQREVGAVTGQQSIVEDQRRIRGDVERAGRARAMLEICSHHLDAKIGQKLGVLTAAVVHLGACEKHSWAQQFAKLNQHGEVEAPLLILLKALKKRKN